MMYYAVAMMATLLLCRRKSRMGALPGGAQGYFLSEMKDAWLVLLPLTFLAVFRWNVGIDSLYGGSYWVAYHDSVQGANLRGFEFLFFNVMRLFAVLEVPFFWFLFALASSFMACVSYAIAKGSVWPAWSIFVFFLLFVYFDCYSSLRQSLAESISLIAWANMIRMPASRKKDAGILVLFAIAGLFHSIAWMNIPVYLVCKLHFRREDMLMFTGILVLMTPVIQAVLKYVMTMFASSAYTFLGVAVINAVMSGFLFVICWIFYDEICRLHANAYMVINLSLCIFILILNSGAMFLPYRVFDMLKIGYVFIVPYLLRGISDSRSRALVCIALAFVFGAWFFNQFFLQNSYTADYQTIFSDWRTIILLK